MSDRTGNGSTTMRRYTVREPPREERGTGAWIGTFVISDDGYFSTVSDYGNYAYYWSHAGSCFRSFLARLDSCYLLSKLCGSRQEYDGNATAKEVKRAIIDARRDGRMGRDEARDEWELIGEHSRLESREDFAFWWRDTKMPDPYEHAVYEYPSQARMFAERAWPAFAAALRAELAAEKATAA